MEHLKNFLDGISSLTIAPTPCHYPAMEGFAKDAENLSGDWVAVGNSLRSALKKERQERAAEQKELYVESAD